MAGKKKAKKELEMLVVASKVKGVMAEDEMRTGGDFTEALNIQVHKLIEDAKRRCADNSRGTVQARDL